MKKKEGERQRERFMGWDRGQERDKKKWKRGGKKEKEILSRYIEGGRWECEKIMIVRRGRERHWRGTEGKEKERGDRERKWERERESKRNSDLW